MPEQPVLRNCPFYGRHAMMGHFFDSCGNQCALVTNNFAPCLREINGESVEWSLCTVWLARTESLGAGGKVQEVSGADPT